jgi:hypothetical protein
MIDVLLEHGATAAIGLYNKVQGEGSYWAFCPALFTLCAMLVASKLGSEFGQGVQIRTHN